MDVLYFLVQLCLRPCTYTCKGRRAKRSPFLTFVGFTGCPLVICLPPCRYVAYDESVFLLG